MAHGAQVSGTGLLHSCAASDWNRSMVSESLELAQAALRYGADINELVPAKALPYNGERRPPMDIPLVEAVIADFPEMVGLLLDNGADSSVIGHSGSAAMRLAVRTGKEEMIQSLKARGVGDECATIKTRPKWRKPLEERLTPESGPIRRRRLSLDS
jgi:hypothetical protein